MAGMDEFGALIKRARELRGMTGTELASQIGRQHSWVVRYERGQASNPPDTRDFDLLSRALGLPKADMLRAIGYLDPEPEDPETVSVPASDPRAELLRVVQGATDDDVRKVIESLKFFLDLFELRRGQSPHIDNAGPTGSQAS